MPKNTFLKLLPALVLIFLLLILARELFPKKHIQTPSPTFQNGEVKIYIPQKDVLIHGQRNIHQVALTFDADMTPKMLKDLKSGKVKSWYNEKIVEILKKENIPATIFMAGMWMETYPQITKELVGNPLFELANHSYSHPSFTPKCYALKVIPDEKDEEEIIKTQKLLFQATGKENHLFRFPGGCHDKIDDQIVHSLGLDIIMWNSSNGDAFSYDTQKLVRNVFKTVQNGSIILMHFHGGPNAPKTAEALPEIISRLKKEGFSFVKVSEIIQP